MLVCFNKLTFSSVLGAPDAVCPKAHKEGASKNGGNISRKDVFSLVGTRPNGTDVLLRLSTDQQKLLLKKLKGDYDKDKKLFEGILGHEVGDELDEELYFITKIKNWERIEKYYDIEEAAKVQKALKNGIFVQQTTKLTMRQ